MTLQVMYRAKGRCFLHGWKGKDPYYILDYSQVSSRKRHGKAGNCLQLEEQKFQNGALKPESGWFCHPPMAVSDENSRRCDT
jgi:hypothetical protein